jgi:hypothetical protein
MESRNGSRNQQMRINRNKESARSLFIKCHTHKGGIYSIFYNDFSGNWFVKLEDGNRPHNPVSLPHRISGVYQGEANCIEAIERFAS